MNDDTLTRIISIFFKYLWLVFGLLILINFASMTFSAYTVMRNAAETNLVSLATELGHRIDESYDLLESLAELPGIDDISIDSVERSSQFHPFANSFNYWMIGVVDPDGTISSTIDNTSSKVERDYIPRIMKNKQREMTEPFPSGATGELNITMLMPVIRNDEVVSIVFLSTLLDDLNETVTRGENKTNGYYILLNNNGTVLSHDKKDYVLKNIKDLTKTEYFFPKSYKKTFLENIENQTPSAYFSYFNNSLLYTVSRKIENTNWNLVHRVKVIPTIKTVLIGFSIQFVLYFLTFLLVHYMGLIYVSRKLQPVNNIIKQVVNLNKELFNSDTANTKELSDIIYISHKGLKDELTDLPTRTLFRQMLNTKLQKFTPSTQAAVFFIDMDNLKTINDSFGHKYGDLAIQTFAKGIQQFAFEHSGFCSRYGGDEFVMFLENISGVHDLLPLAKSITSILQGHIEREGVTHHFHASIGIALFPLHSPNIDVVIQLADIALYESKQRGKNTFTIFSPEEAETKNKIVKCAAA